MPLGGGPACTACNKTVYFSEQVVVAGKTIHKGCSQCCKCNCRLDAGNGRYTNGEFQCANCIRKEFDTKPKMTKITGCSSDAPDACGKCGKTVYMAEEVRAVGKKFHKSCFTCSVCNSHLDSTTLCNKDNVVFCKSCYAKEHGPKGYGYGQGAGALPFTK